MLSFQDKRLFRIHISLLGAVIILVLLSLEAGIQIMNNRKNSMNTSTVLVNQLQALIENTKEQENSLIASLKDDYITRARAAAYIIDHNFRLETEISELNQVKKLLNVDEIHLFDSKGTITFGTVPKYYGINMRDGQQISFFIPMLEDKNLSMCQDVTPNTAEAKAMMYAMSWNESKTMIVQVGIEPVHLMEELHADEIPEILSEIPAYDGIELIIANSETSEIIGSTYSDFMGKKLQDIGINISGSDKISFEKQIINKRSAYCTYKNFESYTILVTKDVKQSNQGIRTTQIIIFIYLFMSGCLIFFIVRKMNKRISKERKYATTDALTGLLNRRRYEEDMKYYKNNPVSDDIVYCSCDLNGLKQANDTYGHEDGDLLLRGSAECLKAVFSSLGQIYRLGGDEFSVILIADSQTLSEKFRTFDNEMEKWSESHGKNLSISYGYVSRQEYPDKNIEELGKIAEARMYQAKGNYYKTSGMERRRF